MPIYAYKCQSCGHSKDVLQKMSDALLVDCPQCGEPTFKKQLTAAGFQLKGSGWYVTDFRDGKAGGDKAKDGDKSKDGEKSQEPSGSEKADAPARSGSDPAAASSAKTPASAPSTAGASAPATTTANPVPVPKAAP